VKTENAVFVGNEYIDYLYLLSINFNKMIKMF